MAASKILDIDRPLRLQDIHHNYNKGNTEILDRKNLYYNEGTSDKVYITIIYKYESADPTVYVLARYYGGRTQTKYNVSVAEYSTYDKVVEAMTKIVDSKLKKGYLLHQSAIPTVKTVKKRQLTRDELTIKQFRAHQSHFINRYRMNRERNNKTIDVYDVIKHNEFISVLLRLDCVLMMIPKNAKRVFISFQRIENVYTLIIFDTDYKSVCITSPIVHNASSDLIKEQKDIYIDSLFTGYIYEDGRIVFDDIFDMNSRRLEHMPWKYRRPALAAAVTAMFPFVDDVYNTDNQIHVLDYYYYERDIHYVRNKGRNDLLYKIQPVNQPNHGKKYIGG